MRTFIQDLRYGMRTMIKSPGFSIVAVLTLALGIGANTTIFSTVRAFLFSPLPVPDPEQLVVPMWSTNSYPSSYISYPNFEDIRAHNKTLKGIIGVNDTFATISNTSEKISVGNSKAEMVFGQLVTWNFFNVLEIKPALGRWFLPEEDQVANARPVVVIGHELWQRRFHSDQSIIGQTVFFNSHPYTVVGVTPQGFHGLKFPTQMNFFIPIAMHTQFGVGNEQLRIQRGSYFFRTVARLKPGVTIEKAEADLKNIANNLARDYPKENSRLKIKLLPEQDGRLPDLTGFIKFLCVIALSATGLVLLLACVNVANLLLSRATSRSREIAIRLSIGASRSRIIRQLLTESLLLALLGGALGLLFASWGGQLVQASLPLFPYPVGLTLDFGLDLLALKWTLGLSFLVTLIFGVMPALSASRLDVASSLKADSVKNYRAHKFNIRNLLVVTQVTISIVVLVCAGLFLRSLYSILHRDKGFSTDNMLSVRVDPTGAGYKKEEGQVFYRELLRRLNETAGIKSASLISNHQLSDGDNYRLILKEGQLQPKPQDEKYASYFIVAPNYFKTMETSLISGREFLESDNTNSKLVAVINRELARKFFGSEENALGKRIRIDKINSPLLEIVGIAENSLYGTFYETKQPAVFLNQFQNSYSQEASLLIKLNNAADKSAVASAIRSNVEQLDPRVPVVSILVGDQVLSFAYWLPRLGAGIASALGILALLIAAIGLYSLISYSVSRRTREMGIRLALGAMKRDILKMIISHGLRLVITGLVVGIVAAFASMRLISGLLFGVSALDPITFIGVAIFFIAIALVACWIPARRAASTDPMTALRYE